MSEQLVEKGKSGNGSGLRLIKTQNGYQVRSGPKTYDVIIESDKITCTCLDFQKQHVEDPNHSCKHIIAILADFEEQQSCISTSITPQPHQADNKLSIIKTGNGASKTSLYPAPTVAPKQPHILIKRSLSADSRIDSISVEIDFGLANEDEELVKAQALKALNLQDSIIKEFISINQPRENLPEPPQVVFPTDETSEEVLDGIMTKVGIAQNKSYYIIVELPESKTAKLFGNQKYLSHQIAVAGFSFPAEKIVEGIILNIPCKVTTVLNGKFINVDKVFPI